MNRKFIEQFSKRELEGARYGIGAFDGWSYEGLKKVQTHSELSAIKNRGESVIGYLIRSRRWKGLSGVSNAQVKFSTLARKKLVIFVVAEYSCRLFQA